eukprot:4819282-Amphidinium_carterae.1
MEMLSDRFDWTHVPMMPCLSLVLVLVCGPSCCLWMCAVVCFETSCLVAVMSQQWLDATYRCQPLCAPVEGHGVKV